MSPTTRQPESKRALEVRATKDMFDSGEYFMKIP
jgi:hypothetical protein